MTPTHREAGDNTQFGGARTVKRSDTCAQ